MYNKTSSPRSCRRLKDTFVPQEEPPRTQAREPSKPMRLPSVEATPPVSPPAVKSPTPFVPSSPPFVPSSPPVVPSSPPAQTTPPSRPSTQPQVRNLLQEALPPRQTSDDEDNDDDDWGDEDNSELTLLKLSLWCRCRFLTEYVVALSLFPIESKLPPCHATKIHSSINMYVTNFQRFVLKSIFVFFDVLPICAFLCRFLVFSHLRLPYFLSSVFLLS